MKKIFLLFFFVHLFANAPICCPQSCDKEVKKAFDELKDEIKKGFEDNVKELNQTLNNYNDLIDKEENSSALLNSYLKRLKIKYIETKKREFLLRKKTDLGVYK